jgi:hypothetical protein
MAPDLSAHNADTALCAVARAQRHAGAARVGSHTFANRAS